jgi:hypothetical protein
MRSKSMVLLVVLTVVGMFPGAAHAKGVRRATVTGPGLDSPITFRMNDPLDGVEAFVNETGIYPSLFETQPNPVVQSQPVEKLGPRYEVAYEMSIPGRKASMVHQDLYPYAQPHPVTYTAPGQPTIDGGESIGGWYVSRSALLPLLVSKGLPAVGAADESASDGGAGTAELSKLPRGEPASSSPWALFVVTGIAALAVTGLVVRKIGRGGLRHPVRAER